MGHKPRETRTQERTRLYREIANEEAILEKITVTIRKRQLMLKKMYGVKYRHHQKKSRLQKNLRTLDAQKVRKSRGEKIEYTLPEKVTSTQYRILYAIEQLGDTGMWYKDLVHLMQSWNSSIKESVEPLEIKGWLQIWGPLGRYKIKLLEYGYLALQLARVKGISKSPGRPNKHGEFATLDIPTIEAGVKNKIKELKIKPYKNPYNHAQNTQKRGSVVGHPSRQEG